MRLPTSLSVVIQLNHHAVKCASRQKTHLGNSFDGAPHSSMCLKLVIMGIYLKYRQNYFQHPTQQPRSPQAHHTLPQRDLALHDAAPIFADPWQRARHPPNPTNNPRLAWKIQVGNLIFQSQNNQALNFACSDHKWMQTHHSPSRGFLNWQYSFEMSSEDYNRKLRHLNCL